METPNKMCPLTQKLCSEERCAWWSTTKRQCAIVLLVQALQELGGKISTGQF